MYAQNTVNVVFTETTLNNAITVIKDARGLNFGEYLNKGGVNAWFLNFNNANCDIKNNNKININNLRISGGVDLDLWVFGVTATGTITGAISGDFEVLRDEKHGYTLKVNPTITSFNYSGPLSSVINVIAFFKNNFNSYVPEIELSMGSSLLPDMAMEYFKSGIPEITSNEQELRLAFKVLFEDLKLKNRILKSYENEKYEASNSIRFTNNFKMESGAKFSAAIRSKPKTTAKAKRLVKPSKYDNLSVGAHVTSDKELITIEPIETLTKDVSSEKQLDVPTTVDVFPNPFTDQLAVKGGNSFSISILDLNGKVLYKNLNLKDVETLDLSHLQTGTYFVKFKINHHTGTKKIIKK